ncbi:MAG: hypothetical protein WAW87_11225 [Candidatus Ferrigenium altingense]
MDPILLFMLYRMLIVLGGILCIYFGYKLFYVTKTKQGDFKIKTGQNYELSLSDVAPGVFFALFGAGVLVFSLTNGITIKPGDLAGVVTIKPGDLSGMVQRQSEISNRPPQPINPPNVVKPAQKSGEASTHAPCMSQRAGEC